VAGTSTRHKRPASRLQSRQGIRSMALSVPRVSGLEVYALGLQTDAPAPPSCKFACGTHAALGLDECLPTHTDRHPPRATTYQTPENCQVLSAPWEPVCPLIPNRTYIPQNSALARHHHRPQALEAPRPRQRHSKQDAAPRQRHRLPKTSPLMTRQGTRSTRRDSFLRPTSSPCRFWRLYPISIWFLVLLFFLIGTHSLPTHCIHHRPGAFWLSS
jgi:hypothetical protein